MALTQITVTGTYKNPDGTVASGLVEFQLNYAIQDGTGHVLVDTSPVTAKLNGSGAISIVLYATDSAGTLPVNNTYHVREVIAGTVEDRVYDMTLPAASPGGTLDLSNVIPMTIPAGASGVGIPAGGTTGQALAKNSSTNYDVGWQTITGGSVDLSAYTAALFGTPRTGDTFATTPTASSGSSTIYAQNRLHYVPLILAAGTLDRIGIFHPAATGAGETARLGIYTDSNGRPATRVVDAGAIDLSTGGNTYQSLTISTVLSATGVYWIALVHQGGATATILGAGGTNTVRYPGQATVTIDPVTVRAGFYEDGISGALPATPGTLTEFGQSTIKQPLVYVRYA